MTRGLLVVGSGPAALAAATAYREHGGAGPVRLVTADDAAPYNRPPLSKDFLRGDVEEADLALQPTDFFDRNEIEVAVSTPVTRLDLGGRRATTADGSRLDFDVLVLATGSEPTRLPVPGADRADVLHLRSLADARRLRRAAEAAGNHQGAVTVVGSGFIGCEAAVSIASHGARVTLVTQEELPQAARLGPEAGKRLGDWLDSAGVRLVTSAEIAAIEPAGSGLRVRLQAADPVEAELVLVAAGVRPRGALAEAAGLVMGDGRIVVDEGMQTSAPGVFAAGDVALAYHAGAGRRISVEHWSDAETMGAVAGANAAGAAQKWDAVPGFWSEIGDRTLKYHAWGDGFDEARLIEHTGGGFSVWYARAGVVVGVLTHEADADYERGRDLVAGAAPAACIADREDRPRNSPTEQEGAS